MNECCLLCVICYTVYYGLVIGDCLRFGLDTYFVVFLCFVLYAWWWGVLLMICLFGLWLWLLLTVLLSLFNCYKYLLLILLIWRFWLFGCWIRVTCLDLLSDDWFCYLLYLLVLCVFIVLVDVAFDYCQ